MGTVVASLTAKLLADKGLGRPARLLLLDPCPTDQAAVISTGDAELVEAVHTSSQGICAERPVGHLDFYPNGGAEQPCGAGPCLDINGNPDWVENHKVFGLTCISEHLWCSWFAACSGALPRVDWTTGCLPCLALR